MIRKLVFACLVAALAAPAFAEDAPKPAATSGAPAAAPDMQHMGPATRIPKNEKADKKELDAYFKASKEASEKGDVQATFRFANGATGTIAYLTGGNVKFPKETIDATGGGRSARLDNFKTASVWTVRGKDTTKARGGQDKGQRAEMDAFVEAVRSSGPMPISVDSSR